MARAASGGVPRKCLELSSKPQCAAKESMTSCACLPAAMDLAKEQSFPLTFTVSPFGSNCSITLSCTSVDRVRSSVKAESSRPQCAANSWSRSWCASSTLEVCLAWIERAKPRILPMTFCVSSLGSNCSTKIAETSGGNSASQVASFPSRFHFWAKASSSGVAPLSNACRPLTDRTKALNFPAMSCVLWRGSNSESTVLRIPSSKELRHSTSLGSSPQCLANSTTSLPAKLFMQRPIPCSRGEASIRPLSCASSANRVPTAL
mmetsp:Transcript_31728/g.69414  ORF Transcript_31728/g.69414 Transcript_31728/m.69414 type:complete len:262 (-) Transcript_31728:45-830(-)